MNFKEWLEAFRIDPEKISDFSNMNTYVGNPEGTSSARVEDGTTKKNLPDELKNWELMKGLFAGKDMKDIIPYAIPRSIPWVLASIDKNKRSLFIQRKDKPSIAKYNPWLTSFDSNNFKILKSGELFTQEPNLPLKQEKIRNVMKFIGKWMKVIFVDDLRETMRDLNRQGINYDYEDTQGLIS
ncbi:MAG: hypothetical protein WCJ72_15590 [Chryseobacterium sp.]